MRSLFFAISLLALRATAQTIEPPVVEFNPLHPVDGGAVEVRWSQRITPSARFGTATVEPYAFFGSWLYGQPHTITILQTAALDGTSPESIDHEVLNLPLQAGSYDLVLQLTVSSKGSSSTSQFRMGSLVVPPLCSSEAAASATYSPDKRGYELHFEDLLTNAYPSGRPMLMSIAGDQVTIQQPATVPGIPVQHPSCVSETVDLGPLAPGTYHLSWVYDMTLLPKTSLGLYPFTRQVTFEVVPPRRRTSRR